MKLLSAIAYILAHEVRSSPCLNNITYTYSKPKENCDWIRWSEPRRQELCQINQIRKNCPQSCGICCDNDPSFQFLDSSSVERDCEWIEKSDMFEYCDKRRNDTTVKFRCPLACNICQTEVFDIIEPPPPPPRPDSNEIPPNEPNSNNSSTANIIIGTTASAMAIFGLVALYDRCRKRDDVLIMTNKEKKKIRKPDRMDTSIELTSCVDREDHFVPHGVPPDGVSIYWIKNRFLREAKQCGLKSSDTTIGDIEDVNSDKIGVIRSIGEHCLCPRDGLVGAAIIDSIDKEEYTGPANLILSYNEEISINDIIAALWDFCFYNNYDAKQVYVWTPFLCDNYHRISITKKFKTHSKELKYSLRKRLSSIGRVLTIVSPWVQSRDFINSWSLYEMFNAIDIGCKIIITTTLKDKNKLITTSLQKEDDLITLFKTIDQLRVQDAVSFSTIENETILRLVRYGPGFDRVNGKLSTRLRRWAKEEVMKALKYHEGRCKDHLKDEDFAFLCSQVGYALIRVNEGTDALSLYNLALKIYQNVRGDEHTDVASLYMNTGMVLQATGDLKGAIKEYNKVLDVKNLVYGENHIEVSNTYNTLGMAQEDDGDLFGAVESYNKALLIREKEYGSENPYTAQSYNHIGLVLNSLGKYKDSLTALEKARDIYIKVKGINHPYTAQAYSNVGYVQHTMGKNEEALKSFRTTLGIVEQVKGEENNEEAKANAYTNIAMVLGSLQDFDGSIFHYKTALGMLQEIYGENSVEMAISLFKIGCILMSKTDYRGAIVELNKSERILSITLGPNHQHSLTVKENIKQCENEIRLITGEKSLLNDERSISSVEETSLSSSSNAANRT